MEEEAPPSRAPARCSTTTVFATATTGTGDDPSSSSDHALRCIVMTSTTTQLDEHELHSSPSPSLFPPLALTTAPPCIFSSSASATACIATSSYDYGQPELYSLPPPCRLPSPKLCSSEWGSASGASMIPSYHQIPPVPVFDGSSLHARGISQSFNASGNIISADLDVPRPVASFPPLSSLHGQQQQAQPASTTSAGMVLGQTDHFFGLAQSTSSKPSLSFVSSFGVPFPDLGEAPAVSQSQLATPLQNLGSQQQQHHPARASSLASSVVLGQSHRFAGFRQSTWEHQQAPQQGRTRSSSRSAGLPPRWRPPSRSRIDSTTTFAYVQPPSSDSKLPPLPPSLQTPPSPPVELAHTGCETPGQGAGFFMGTPFQNMAGQQPLLDSPWRERFQLNRNSSFMDDGAMVSMPTLSVGASGSSSGSLLFTDVEMEKIRKEDHLSHLMKTDPNRVRRILSIRGYAKESKERKESHRVSLEDRLKSLETEHETLSRQVKLQQKGLAEVESQNRMLKTRLQGLDQQLKLKKDLNETLRSEIQNVKLANLSSSSSLHQQMSLASGHCSNTGLHHHMRNEVHVGLHIVQLEQPEMQEQSLEHQEDMAAKEPQEK